MKGRLIQNFIVLCQVHTCPLLMTSSKDVLILIAWVAMYRKIVINEQEKMWMTDFFVIKFAAIKINFPCFQFSLATNFSATNFHSLSIFLRSVFGVQFSRYQFSWHQFVEFQRLSFFKNSYRFDPKTIQLQFFIIPTNLSSFQEIESKLRPKLSPKEILDIQFL